MTLNPLCNSCCAHVEQLVDFGEHPIVNKLAHDPNEVAKKHRMIVGGCISCGLVQLTQPIDPIEFYTDYATPTSWKREPHIGKLLNRLRAVVPREDRILDVGCNDGRFLTYLRDSGWSKLTGLEPSKNTAESAKSQGFDIVNSSLTSALADELVMTEGSWGCVILRQVLEHVVNLTDFGSALNRLLRRDGILVIEVPDSRVNMLQHDYALWEEHVNYFTPATLEHFLKAHGFEIFDMYTSAFSGVCLTVLARNVGNSSDEGILGSRPSAPSLSEQIGTFRAWASDFPAFRAAIANEVADYANRSQVALYGVGSRSSNFINIMNLGELISLAIDDQPQKQNCFMPGSGTAIVSSSDAAEQLRPNSCLLLGVNGENEEFLLTSSPLMQVHFSISVLPPSRRLLNAWGSIKARSEFSALQSP